MIYSAIKQIYRYNLGRGYSAVNRQKALHKLGIDSKLLTRDFSITQYQIGKWLGLDYDNDVINMYDYFLGLTGKNADKWRTLNIRECPDLDLSTYLVGVNDDGTLDYKKYGKTYFRALMLPYSYGVLGSIQAFDDNERLLWERKYDWRGYPVVEDHYDIDGQILSEDYLDINGNVKIKTQYMKMQNGLQLSYYRLLNHNGQDYLFESQDQMFNFFVQEILSNEPGALIVDDVTLTNSLDEINTFNNPKYLYLHQNHLEYDYDYRNQKDDTNYVDHLQPTYKQFLFNEAQYFSGLIVSNNLQANNLRQILVEAKDSIKVLPDNIVFDEVIKQKIHLNTNKEKPINVGYIGNLDYTTKNFEELVQVFKFIKENSERPVKFTIYAHLNNVNEINNILAKYDMNKLVDFNEPLYGIKYINEINKKVDVVISATTSEAGSMALTDMLSLGKPIVAYDCLFGNAYHLKNNKTALLSTPHNYEQLAKNAVKLINDMQLQNKLAQNSKQYAKRFLTVQYFKQNLKQAKLIK